tara:strand:+ start:629 stop:784 length:156 start_codon:yes stop_codon:yes gene_type:complete
MLSDSSINNIKIHRDEFLEIQVNRGCKLKNWTDNEILTNLSFLDGICENYF